MLGVRGGGQCIGAKGVTIQIPAKGAYLGDYYQAETGLY